MFNRKSGLIISIMVILLSFGVLPACSEQEGLLPHAVYFLEGWEEESQVWKLEADGVTMHQLTFELGGVDAFSVSQKDGSLAFVSDNRLYITEPDGINPHLIADASKVDPQIEDYIFHGFIDSPVFSPDGRYLAYAFDGLHIFNLATGEDEHILKNLGNLMGESYVFAEEAYYPELWSPDGNQLLFSMGYYEGATLAIMEMGREMTFKRLLSGDAVCCLFSWTPDNTQILVANPFFTTIRPSLWRYDAISGEKTSLITDHNLGRTLNYVGWPQQLSTGELYFFYYGTEQFSPETGIPLRLVHSQPDGSEPQEVRPEAFEIKQVLWSDDELKALILGRTEGDTHQLFYLPDGGKPIQILINDAHSLQSLTWGP